MNPPPADPPPADPPPVVDPPPPGVPRQQVADWARKLVALAEEMLDAS